METKKTMILDWIKAYNEWEYEKALLLLDDMISTAKDDVLALFYRWNTLWALGRFDDAIKEFENIIKKDPKNDKALKAKEIYENIRNAEAVSYWCQEIAESTSDDILGSFEQEDVSPPPMAAPAPISSMPGSWISYKKASKPSSEPYVERKESKICKDTWFYDFLKSSEAKKFFTKMKWSADVSNIIENFWANELDKVKMLEYIKSKDEKWLTEIIKNIKLRNKIIDYLADSNILPPRKYNTIISQINNINADFWLAFIMFNLWEEKYNEILVSLWERIWKISEKTDTKDSTSEKIWLAKIIANFFLQIFAFEKSFANENNKLRYFRYLFVLFWFLSVLVLIGYWMKNDYFKTNIKASRVMSNSWTVESVVEVRAN